MSLGAMGRLLSCDLEVMGSNPGNLSACGSKATYFYPLQTPLGGSLVDWAAHYNPNPKSIQPIHFPSIA